jgi:hypothetical protein
MFEEITVGFIANYAQVPRSHSAQKAIKESENLSIQNNFNRTKLSQFLNTLNFAAE